MSKWQARRLKGKRRSLPRTGATTRVEFCPPETKKSYLAVCRTRRAPRIPHRTAMLSPTELITFLTRNQFLAPAQGDALTKDRSRFVSSVQLCGELVLKGWLTPYQQAQLLSGNGDKL